MKAHEGLMMLASGLDGIDGALALAPATLVGSNWWVEDGNGPIIGCKLVKCPTLSMGIVRMGPMGTLPVASREGKCCPST